MFHGLVSGADVVELDELVVFLVWGLTDFLDFSVLAKDLFEFFVGDG